MIDDLSLPDLSPPPSTNPAVIKDLSNQLELALGITHSPPSSSITGPITPSPSHPSLTTRSSVDAGHTYSRSTGCTPAINTHEPLYSDEDRGKSPTSIVSLPLSTTSKIRTYAKPFNRILHRFDTQPTYEPTWLDTTPSQPIHWVIEAGLRARWSDLVDVDILRRDQAYLIRHVPHTVHDEQKRSGLRVTLDITRVIHGTYFTRPSVFVGLVVSHMNRKVPQTKIRVDVSTGGLGNLSHDEYLADPSIHQPVIVKFAPKKHYGDATSVDKSQDIGIEGKVSGPSTITNTGVTATVNRSTSYSLKERHCITTHTSSEARKGIKTILELEALENTITKDGIYDQLARGMIIETRSKPVILTFDVSPTQGVFNKTFRYVTPSDFYTVPVYIDGQDWGLDGMPDGWTREMGDWDTRIWRHLVKYDEEYESVSWTRIGMWLNICSLADLGGLVGRVIVSILLTYRFSITSTFRCQSTRSATNYILRSFHIYRHCCTISQPPSPCVKFRHHPHTICST
jgi:hypothetical protein